MGSQTRQPGITRPVDASAQLARFAAALRFDDLPAAVVAQAKLSLLDILGVALAGAALGEGCDEVLAYLDASAGRGCSTVWSSGQGLPPAQAALANAAHARALDYDDIIPFPQIHVASSVVPAVLAVAEAPSRLAVAEAPSRLAVAEAPSRLAVAEAPSRLAVAEAPSRPVDGRALLCAVAVGCEVQSRLAAALAPHFGSGLPVMLSSQVFGYFSAAAACGSLLGLPPDVMLSAFGFALMQAAGTEEMVVHAEASVGKCLYGGFSNQGGVQSALMAQHGLPARGEPLEGRAGLFAAFYGGAYDKTALTDGLGTRFVSLERCFKTMPGTLVSHTFAEAALALMHQHAVQPDDIVRVRLDVGPWGAAMCEPAALRRRPASASAAMNSIPFIVAKALANGTVALDDFLGPGRMQATALAMADRIDHVVDPGLARPRGLEPGVVTLTLASGRLVQHRIEAPRGHPARPMSAADAAAKFRVNASHAKRPLEAWRVERIIERLATLEDCDDVGSLLDLIARRGPDARGDLDASKERA